MPVPGAPSYALSNLEHTVLTGLTPAWVKDMQEAFYYGGLTGGRLVILVTIWFVYQCTQLPQQRVVASAPATNVFTTVPPPTPRYCEPSFPVVTETPFTTAPLGIEDHHVDAQPLRDAVVEGGCRGGAVKVVNSTYPLVFRR